MVGPVGCGLGGGFEMPTFLPLVTGNDRVGPGQAEGGRLRRLESPYHQNPFGSADDEEKNELPFAASVATCQVTSHFNADQYQFVEPIGYGNPMGAQVGVQ